DSDVPIVAGRDALHRVFVAADEEGVGSHVTATLAWGNGAPVERELVVGASSEDRDLGSTFDFDIAGADVVPGATYRVELSGAAVESPYARFPVVGDRAAVPVSPFGQLRVVVVPIRYGGDGSGRVPDTSPAVLAAYARAFERLYPVARVDVSVRSPWSYDLPVAANDEAAWTRLLTAFTKLRGDDDAPDDAYYFGAFDPADSRDDYCLAGCFEGLGHVVTDPLDALDRAAVGLGFADVVGRVAPHEVGHEHGRMHAPCGPGVMDVDPDYPSDAAHAGGRIGVWGYDVLHERLVAPRAHDFMGYCEHDFTSDYTYAGIFARVAALGALTPFGGGAAGLARRTFARALLREDGTLVPLAPVVLRSAGVADHPVRIETAAGVEVAMAHLSRFDHAPGGVLTWPSPSSPPRRVSVELEGRLLELVP
ncbi:MAG TPA: hypothetical protein VHB21_28475, partial [Minicystis sp.]|nr:hypothetical protein [Minicystis sp.]